MTKLPVAIAIFVTALAVAAPARAKVARCDINAEVTSYQGPCQYNVARGGTFTLTPARGGAFGEIKAITVYVKRAGVAEVRGLTVDGESLPWGRAVRSTRNRACWVGQNFSVCAY